MRTIIQEKLPRVTFFPNKPGDPYRPCNGSEGEFFIAMWCEECEHDKVMNGSAKMDDADRDPDLYCEILSRSFRDEPLPEWNYGDDGQPRCANFAPIGTVVLPRCEHTTDMFETPNVEVSGEEERCTAPTQKV